MLFKKSSLCTAAVIIALLTVLHFSCSENPAENNKSTEKRLTIVSGNNQSERVGMVLPESLVVKTGDMLGNPARGMLVHFSTGDSAAVVSPGVAVTGHDGIAKCSFRLGAVAGSQHVMATIETDTTIFTETAVEPECSEESTEPFCGWPAGHVLIATTSSSLLSGSGTVILDFDPASGSDPVKIYETTDTLTDISFSSRGELFLATRERLMKLDPDTHQPTFFCALSGGKDVKLDENPGGIMAGITIDGPFAVFCPLRCVKPFFDSNPFTYIDWGNVAVNPRTRDLYFLTGLGHLSYNLWRVAWDGRAIPPLSAATIYKNLITTGGSDATPKGMCFDDGDNLYISFDSSTYTNPFRRIVRVASDGTVDYSFFDLYAHGGNNQDGGRWGDIAYSNGKLYLIDTRNDRLAVISTSGEWLDEFSKTAFSMPLIENESYSIAAVPDEECP